MYKKKPHHSWFNWFWICFIGELAFVVLFIEPIR